MVNKNKVLIKKNDENRNEFNEYYKKQKLADILMNVISVLPILVYCVVFAFSFMFCSKPDAIISYIFSVIITFTFEAVDWYKLVTKKKDDNVFDISMRRDVMPFVLILIIFSILLIVHIRIRSIDFSWLAKRNVSTDAIAAFAVFLYLLSCCVKNIYSQFKKEPNEQAVNKFYRNKYKKANHHEN